MHKMRGGPGPAQLVIVLVIVVWILLAMHGV